MRAILAAALLLGVAAAVEPPAFDCLDGGGVSTCHFLADCVGQGVCRCPQGTIDPAGDGLLCIENGYAIRYVAAYDLTGTPSLAEIQAIHDNRDNLCLDNGAKGLFARGVPDIFSSNNANGVSVFWRDDLVILEINCLYQNKPTDTQLAEYGPGSGLWAWNAANRLNVEPAVYTWTLPSTDNPIRVSPTGMEVSSVSFNSACEATGCWVIKGTLTTGAGFNTYETFNTLFLPEAESPSSTGDLSYDYSYSSEAWTFEPANHPCTSAQYEADDETAGLSRVSTCCIDNSGVGAGGGFISNYRPTDAFIDFFYDNSYLSPSSSCDAKIVQRPGYSAIPATATPEVGGPTCMVPTDTKHDTWHNAEAECNGLEGHLASPDNEREWHWVFSLAIDQEYWYFWLGFNVPDEAGQTMNPDDVLTTDGSAFVLPPNAQLNDNWFPLSSGNGSNFGLVHANEAGTIPETVGEPFFGLCALPMASERCISANQPRRRSEGEPYDIPFPTSYLNFLKGPFKGMPESAGVVSLTPKDHFFGQYDFEIHLDEVELRSKAGMLTGTVGVEHTVDTFLGFANFRPTGLAALDTFSTQVNIHLEKTSFFSVSTHGVNEYTFLEYVNMRLVTIYNQDDDFSDNSGMNNGGGSTLDFIETDSTGSADYVQVTFTLGPQYEVNTNSELIPSTSVRAGKGTFLADAESSGEMSHKCTDYNGEFVSLLAQACSPNSVMCTSPSAIPDQFVSYNIPLGIDYFPAATTDLSANIFVHMVVSAIIKPEARMGMGFENAPNAGGNPFQMKTTLSASIPVVEGGINIFCDGLVAKTDLKDVANADIIVGSASSSAELSRLRIKKNVASTQLAEADEVVIDSDSIEAGLMTLVLNGNSSYFGLSGNMGVSIELEDVITIHVMQDDGIGQNADVITRAGGIEDLLDDSPDDNSFSDGLNTDGYALNGAFYFEIDRDSQRAHLEPSSALLSICPFNPTRPTGVELETCVTRRDVRYRGYPARTGSLSTAMEICSNVVGNAGDDCSFAYDSSTYDSSTCCTQLTTSDESKFFTTIFGDNDYAKQLAVDFANVVADEYQLNGRFRRAFWINPGYEWTPTQTGGASIFQVSQKIFMFALITLDEGIVPPVPRRMLLQTADGLKDAQASGAGNVMTFQTTPTSMMAKAFDVPVDRVAAFAVKLQLTEAEACKTGAQLQDALRLTLDDYMSGAASSYETVQVTKMTVNKGSVQCPAARRSVRSLLAFSDATADVTMLVVFSKGGEATISLEKLAAMSGVQSIEPVSVSPKIKTADATYVPPAKEEDSSSGSDIGLIAGAAGGGAAALLLVVGVVVMMKRRSAELTTPSVVQTINVADLKSQLASEA